MSLQQQERIKSLEARVAALEAKLAAPQVPLTGEPNLAPTTPAVAAEPKETKRGLCPKCGVKPNYYMHVRWCKGTQGQ
jgi:hypothetical protein